MCNTQHMLASFVVTSSCCVQIRTGAMCIVKVTLAGEFKMQVRLAERFFLFFVVGRAVRESGTGAILWKGFFSHPCELC